MINTMTESNNEIKDKIDHIVLSLKEILKRLPSGRASTELLDGIDITTNYGKQRIKHIASVKVVDVRTLSILPFDQHHKSLLGQISESISNGTLKLNAQVSGNEVIVKLSDNTAERNQELKRATTQEGESKKQELRDLRHKYTNTKTLKAFSASEDEQQRRKKDLEKLFKEGDNATIKLVEDKLKDLG